MGYLTLGVGYAVPHVRPVIPVVKVHELSGNLIYLTMGRHARIGFI